MLFVTVGTHEQPFNRLIHYIDDLKRDNIIQDEVVMQIGFSTYIPQYCQWSKLIPYKDVEKMIETARIVITHGGPASFVMPLQIGKIPVVVPRQHIFQEHVNDHQIEFVKAVAQRMGNIIPVYEITKLKEVVLDYKNIIESMSHDIKSNNINFNRELERIVNSLF